VNYDNSLVVTITVTCNLWAPSSGDHLFTCGAIYLPPHKPIVQLWKQCFQSIVTNAANMRPVKACWPRWTFSFISASW